jgi:thiol-disulfide isomerase/thioredoxin
MASAPRLLGILATLTISLAAFGVDGEALPRYRLQPGQELAFRSSTVFKSGEGKTASELSSQSDWTAWVLRANSDGSFRLVLREKNVLTQTFQGKKSGQDAETRIVYADVFPDGRVRMNPTILFQGHSGELFPLLPADARQASTGWESVAANDKFTCKRMLGVGGFVFEAVKHSPWDEIYLSSSKTRYTFDAAKGVVTRGEIETRQGHGLVGKGTGTMELVAVKTMAPPVVEAMAQAADQYFGAVAAYEDKTKAAVKATPEEAKILLAGAVEGLKAAAGTLKNEELKASLTAKIAQHADIETDCLDEARRRVQVLHKPAADFQTTDIDGKPVKLADLRGKVVVLDFWYRGCGWCIKAMPQMNQLANDFAGKPVAIFGMNTDRKEADARFVIEKMGLKYPTLKAEGLPEKFGVQGFPTLILIDPQGRVHDVHVGYTPTLRQDLGKQIRELLAGK